MTEPFSSDDIPWAQLGRYLAGELGPEERQAVERWIASAPDRVELVDELRQLWAVAPTFRQQWEVEAAIRRVVQPTAAPARIIRLPAFYREAPDAKTRRLRRLALRAAAVVALLGGGIWLLRRPTTTNTVAIATSEIRTPRGQRAELRLSDGSEVKLGPATVMRYAVDPRRGPRTVELDGEAYFVVAHDAARPFTVRTAHGMATDLGTRFGIRAYRTDSITEVAVEEGAVSLATLRPGQSPAPDPGTHQVVLRAHDVGTATAGGRITAQRGTDMAAHLAWKDGRLELDAVPLRDAVIELGRWYGIEIHLGDSAAADRRLRASFKDESVAEALQLIAATLTLRIERHGAAVTLWSK